MVLPRRNPIIMIISSMKYQDNSKAQLIDIVNNADRNATNNARTFGFGGNAEKNLFLKV